MTNPVFRHFFSRSHEKTRQTLLKIWQGSLRPVLKKVRGRMLSGLGYFLFMKTFVLVFFTKRFKLEPNSSTILLIFPDDYNSLGKNFNGGAKDIQSLHEQVDSLKLKSDHICVSRFTSHALAVLLNKANRQRIFSASKIIISIPGKSGFILLFLRLLGFSNVIFRSHNAELLHRIDWLRNAKSIPVLIRALKKMISGGFSDLWVSLFAERVWSVSELEMEKYWKRFFPWVSQRMLFFPGMSPSHIARSYSFEGIRLNERSFATIVGGFQSGTVISQPDRQFLENGWLLRDYVHSLGLSLVSVGDRVSFDFCDLNLGLVENYEEILKNTSLIIVPSSVGWGFKTKISDAVTLHQSIILPRKQYDRLGEWAQMVTPIDNWEEISTLVLKKIGSHEYEDFIETLRVRREMCLLDLA